MWPQIVGKIRLTLAPQLNHLGGVPLPDVARADDEADPLPPDALRAMSKRAGSGRRNERQLVTSPPSLVGLVTYPTRRTMCDSQCGECIDQRRVRTRAACVLFRGYVTQF
jgi:hypothetical protein